QQHVLAAPLGLGDLAALEPGGELLSLAVTTNDPHRVARRADLRALDLPSDHVLLEVPTHHLDFRKLHRPLPVSSSRHARTASGRPRVPPAARPPSWIARRPCPRPDPRGARSP